MRDALNSIADEQYRWPTFTGERAVSEQGRRLQRWRAHTTLEPSARVRMGFGLLVVCKDSNRRSRHACLDDPQGLDSLPCLCRTKSSHLQCEGFAAICPTAMKSGNVSVMTYGFIVGLIIRSGQGYSTSRLYSTCFL